MSVSKLAYFFLLYLGSLNGPTHGFQMGNVNLYYTPINTFMTFKNSLLTSSEEKQINSINAYVTNSSHSISYGGMISSLSAKNGKKDMSSSSKKKVQLKSIACKARDKIKIVLVGSKELVKKQVGKISAKLKFLRKSTTEDDEDEVNLNADEDYDDTYDYEPNTDEDYDTYEYERRSPAVNAQVKAKVALIIRETEAREEAVKKAKLKREADRKRVSSIMKDIESRQRATQEARLKAEAEEKAKIAMELRLKADRETKLKAEDAKSKSEEDSRG